MNDALIDWVTSTGLGNILPVSPVQKFIHVHQNIFDSISEYIGYLNWFIPVNWIVSLLVTWLFCIGIFYGVQWLLRTINVIGS